MVFHELLQNEYCPICREIVSPLGHFCSSQINLGRYNLLKEDETKSNSSENVNKNLNGNKWFIGNDWE